MPPDAVPPDEPTDEEKLEELDEDTNQTPFRPAADTDEPVIDPDAGELVPTESEEQSIPSSMRGGIDDTHPDTDSNLERDEQYDEGIAGAAEANEPNVGDAVIGYNPPKRRNTK